MPVTRAKVEAIIVQRRQAWMDIAGYDVTYAGTNASLGSIIAQALLSMGIPVVDPLNPTDTDLAGVPDDQLDQLIMWCDTLLLYSLQAAIPSGSLSIAGLQVDIGSSIRQAIQTAESYQRRQYTFTASRMSLGYAASRCSGDEFTAALFI